MAGDLFSASWYRVKRLIPRLRSHVRLHRHQYRGHLWYVLQDLATDRFHRFAPAAYAVIGLMNGRSTVQQIWEDVTEHLGDEAPTQQEIIGLLSQLYAADADMSEFHRRSTDRARRTMYGRIANAFSLRIPLGDPDQWLTRVAPLMRPFISWPAGMLWLLIVGWGAIMGAMHWTDLAQDVSAQALAPQHVLLLWLLFPLLKLCHESAHAVAAKGFGGDVHEFGVMLLVFTPVPYVDATAVWEFRSKWQRIAVGAAGMMVELFLAALALFVWLNAEPGLVRMVALQTMLIAGISTVVFNANPLLRFDGYYMLMDFLEIPNLKLRANRYLVYLAERYLLGQDEAELPQATAGERAWFVAYGVASSLFRVVVVIGILLFLGDRFPLLAVLFAALTAATMVGVPLAKGLSFLLTSPRLRRVRVRAVTAAVCLVAAVVGLIGFVPIPFHTLAEGIVWLPDEAFVRAGADGFVDQVVAQPGARVQPGDVLAVCRNPDLAAQLAVLEARLLELKARRTEQQPTDRVKVAILEEEIAYVTKERARVRERVDRLIVRSRLAGTFVAPLAQDLPGRFVRHGEVLGHVLDVRTIIVRALVGQEDIDLVRHQLDSVEVRLAEQVRTAVPADLSRVVPAATKQLPSAALGSQGGGQTPMDPSDSKGLTALQRHFQVDLTLAGPSHVVDAGGRAYVRFNHGWAPALVQWTRHIRQVFLTRFNA